MDMININSQLINVIIVDDHKMIAEGLEKLINESTIAQVIGKEHSIKGCLSLLEHQQPDVLLLDIGLPDGNGIDACALIKKQYPDVKILMLTSYSELSVISRALGEGALGYVLKNSMVEEIIEGIRVVASGKPFFCEEVDMLLKTDRIQHITLTSRERELLKLIVEGCSNNDIAQKMCLGYETIKSYRKNLILKLNAHNTAILVRIALEQKLV
ncbi:MAG: response regulator transcription factor [Prevotellaceae bacterium]|jgi:DNA-binding NarL/FixJ family response regulator|nr:response regulator transcription factor [Prevotellaceae bacterium]